MRNTPDKAGEASISPDAQTTDLTPRPAAVEPNQIGAYRILEMVGEGGMGIVYKAEQREPVRRIVALKVIKLGMDTREVIARFEAERQALALMSHPNVARVFDGGISENGRPYFAMEHVPGIALTDYCNQSKLNTRQRLELFIPICHAIQHAHQKGIIHRDLKPSNILVQMVDGKPMAKVIDFGIAKATNSALTQNTLFTRTGAMVGTPEYMSPEQAGTSGLDVDTRTDIYSLGVILYELLTGLLPFDAKTLRSAGLEGMARMIRESEPHKPSTRLAAPAGDAKGDTAVRGRGHSRALRREISGDLDWITLKAMEKDRTRRYETANGLALDIRRHLNDEPVLARPPNASYRMSKFIRKHKGGVVAAGFVLVALLLGIIGTSVGMVKAQHAESKAKAESDKAWALSGFMEDLLSSAQPGATGGRAAKVVDMLDRASAEMSEKLRDQPEAEIRARTTLAKTYYALNIFPPAEQNYRRAYELAQSTLGKDAERTLDIAADLAFAITQSGQNIAEAKMLAEQTLATARRTLGEHHRVSYNAANSLNAALGWLGQHREGSDIERQLVNDARAHPNVVSQAEFARYLNNLSSALYNAGLAKKDPLLFAESENCLREVLQMAASGAKINPVTVTLARQNLALQLKTQGRIPEASAVWHEALANARATLGESHPITRTLIIAGADGLESLQEYEEAIACRREQLAFALEAQPQDEEYIGWIKYKLGWELVQIGKFSEALAYNAESIATRQKLFGIYDEGSRNPWFDGLILELSVNQPWTSQMMRAGACEALESLLYFHPTWTMPADRLIPERLRFKLFKWEGENAGKEKALTAVAEGNSADLHKLSEPPAGIYLMWLEVPRANRTPLHYTNWMVVAPWQVSFFNIKNSPEEKPEEWEQTIRSNPVRQATIPTLALDEFWHFNSDLPPRLTLFGTVATATMDLPAGRYNIVSRAAAKHRIWVDDSPLTNSWQFNATVAITKSPGPTRFRVEHFHTWNQNFYLWLGLRPVGPVADAVIASLIDPREPIAQAAEKFDDPQYPHTVARIDRRWKDYFALGRFQAAADDIKILTGLLPDDHWHPYRRGCLLAYLGDIEAYRANCRSMLAKFGDTKVDVIADRTAKTCLLIPGAGGDIGQLNKMLDMALAKPSPYFKMAKGLAEYRAGHFEAALDWLTQSEESMEKIACPWVTTEAVLAMALHRMGHATQAKECLNRAIERAQKDLPKPERDLLLPGDMENWLIAQIILREATELIKGK